MGQGPLQGTHNTLTYWYLLPVNLQDVLGAMYGHACEASALLSGFKHVSQDCTALTSECGSLLEEVNNEITS
jgi:hypothetical protein